MQSKFINGFRKYFSRIGNVEQTVWKYFIDRVYLLPIVLDGKDMAEATSRALTIFETINNRGRDLADADILKAKLYEMASSVKEGNEFILEWKKLGQKMSRIEHFCKMKSLDIICELYELKTIKPRLNLI